MSEPRLAARDYISNSGAASVEGEASLMIIQQIFLTEFLVIKQRLLGVDKPDESLMNIFIYCFALLQLRSCIAIRVSRAGKSRVEAAITTEYLIIILVNLTITTRFHALNPPRFQSARP